MIGDTMTVFFQTYSLWQALLVLPYLRSATRVAFYPPFLVPPRPVQETLVRRCNRILVTLLIRWLNPSAVIENIDWEGCCALGLFQNNVESDRYVEEVFERASRSVCFRIVSRLVCCPQVGLSYKIRFLDPIRHQTVFLRAIPKLLGNERDGIAVPSHHDRYAFHRHFMSEEDYRKRVPIQIRLSHRFRDWTIRLLSGLCLTNPLLLALIPVWAVASLVLRRGLTRRRTQFDADIIMPMIWGFGEEGVVGGLRRLDNSYVTNEALGFDRLAFCFSEWMFTAEEKAKQRHLMEQKGIRYVDAEKLIPSLEYLRQSGSAIIMIWMALFRSPWVLWEEPWFALVSAKLLYFYFRELLFASTVKYNVWLEYQDYCPQHVLRTILAAQRGRQTIALHHNAPDGPWNYPVMRYTYVSRLCAWGEAFSRLNAPHWDHMKIHPVGPPRLDYVVEAQQEDKRCELDRLYQTRYGGRRPLVVMLFPAPPLINVTGRLAQQFEGLRRLRDVPGRFQIVCRFRRSEHMEFFRRFALDEIMARDPRIVIDMTDLTTYEWFALSDAVIVNGISSGMVEAAGAGKPCFSFDHLLIAETVYRRYGTGLILKTADDLVRVIQAIPEGFRGWDCRWDQFARDYCYFTDGKNMDRLRRIILDVNADVQAGRRADVSGTSYCDPTPRLHAADCAG